MAKDSSIWCKYKTIIKSAIVMLLIASIPIGFYTAKFYKQSFSGIPSDWGNFGAYIGGTLGALFTFISVIAVLYTINSQKKQYALEHFENKYYQLLNIHIKNANDLSLKENRGKRVFALIFKEFGLIKNDIYNHLKNNSDYNKIDEKELLLIKAAYIVLFFGLGSTSSRIVKAYWDKDKDKDKDEDEEFLNSYILAGQLFKIENFSEILSHEYGSDYISEVNKKDKLGYSWKDGHVSRLAHYYRHLYQFVKFVDESELISEDEKYEYVKKIRAQLSNHEQALLFLNSLTPMGKDWWLETEKGKGVETSFMWKYRLISNIPEDFFDPQYFDITKLEIDKKKLEKGYFEWQRGSDCIDHNGNPKEDKKVTFSCSGRGKPKAPAEGEG